MYVRVGQAALGVNHGATIHEQARHIDAGSQYSARIVPQIQHQAFKFLLLHQRVQ